MFLNSPIKYRSRSLLEAVETLAMVCGHIDIFLEGRVHYFIFKNDGKVLVGRSIYLR